MVLVDCLWPRSLAKETSKRMTQDQIIGASLAQAQVQPESEHLEQSARAIPEVDHRRHVFAPHGKFRPTFGCNRVVEIVPVLANLLRQMHLFPKLPFKALSQFILRPKYQDSKVRDSNPQYITNFERVFLIHLLQDKGGPLRLGQSDQAIFNEFRYLRRIDKCCRIGWLVIPPAVGRKRLAHDRLGVLFQHGSSLRPPKFTDLVDENSTDERLNFRSSFKLVEIGKKPLPGLLHEIFGRFLEDSVGRENADQNRVYIFKNFGEKVRISRIQFFQNLRLVHTKDHGADSLF